jgi:hypothetical protein
MNSKRRTVEDGEVLRDCTASRFRRQTRGAFDAVAIPGVGLDQTGIDCKAFATNQTLGNAALQHALEQTSQQSAIAETTVPVL